METDTFIMESLTLKCPKTRVSRNETRDIFIQCLVLNKIIIPLMLVRYELMIADSMLCALFAI